MGVEEYAIDYQQQLRWVMALWRGREFQTEKRYVYAPQESCEGCEGTY